MHAGNIISKRVLQSDHAATSSGARLLLQSSSHHFIQRSIKLFKGSLKPSSSTSERFLLAEQSASASYRLLA
jgi:hypothetical protein